MGKVTTTTIRRETVLEHFRTKSGFAIRALVSWVGWLCGDWGELFLINERIRSIHTRNGPQNLKFDGVIPFSAMMFGG